MIHRAMPNGTFVITQTTHAWLSAQFAQHWGNEQFGSVTPAADVHLGTALHDIGWVAWENNPKFNQKTGLPHTFIDLERGDHLSIWASSSRLALPFGRYPALLVSMHGTRLYSMIDYAKEYPDHIDDINVYLMAEKALQNQLIASLQADSYYAQTATDEQIARNSKLVAIWDWLSLLICHKVTKPRVITDIPSAADPLDMTLTPVKNHTETIQLTPWPFTPPKLSFSFSGRLLHTIAKNSEEMAKQLQQAPWQTVTIHLVKSEDDNTDEFL